MPLQLYDKEKILDTCLAVFARHGYEKTSTVMLAEAAGISRALIFHHFKSKRELYLYLVDRCFTRSWVETGADALPEYQDFFEAREKFSIEKFYFRKENPDVDKVLKEAFFATPDELETEIEERYGSFIAEKNKLWERLFEKVPLKDGVDRGEAFELIMLTLDYFDKKYFSKLTDENYLDETYVQSFLDERNRFLAMVRYGIEK